MENRTAAKKTFGRRARAIGETAKAIGDVAKAIVLALGAAGAIIAFIASRKD